MLDHRRWHYGDSANSKMYRLKIVTVCGTALLIAAAVGVAALRNRRQPVPPPEVPVAQTTAEVRVKAVERKVETLDSSNVEVAKLLKCVPRRTSTEFGILFPEAV